MSLVKLEGVTRTFGTGDAQFHALRQVNLSVEQGELVAIMGPSGSGKSTLLHLIAGLDQPSVGRVHFDGRPLNDLPDKTLSVLRRQQIGFIFQFFNLIPALTSRDNVAVPLLLDSVPRAKAFQRADEVLASVGLSDRAAHLPAQLSGGQQQRVSIARALVINPALILADEPTGALDSETGQEVIRILMRLVRQQQCTVILVTHDPRVAAFADRIISFRDGRVADDSVVSKRAPQTEHALASAR